MGLSCLLAGSIRSPTEKAASRMNALALIPVKLEVVHPRFSVSLIFGPAVADEGVPGSEVTLSSSIACIGGLVAKGDGTAAGNPKERLLPPTGGPRLKPKFTNPGAVGGGGLVAEVDGVKGGGIVPLLNSAQRGHLRFVSAMIHA